MSPQGSRNSKRFRGLSPWAIGTAVLVVILVWWWPGLTGRGDRAEVVIVGSGVIAESREEVSRRVRESGLSLRWEEGVGTWCEVTKLLDDTASVTVVVAPDDLEPCGADDNRVDESTLSAGDARRLIVVALAPSATADELEAKGARRVPTGRLIGGIDEPMPCLWWDDCPSSGSVVTRTDSGLTEEGRQRLARLIATLTP